MLVKKLLILTFILIILAVPVFSEDKTDTAVEHIQICSNEFQRNTYFESNPRLKHGDKLYVPMTEKVVTVTGIELILRVKQSDFKPNIPKPEPSAF